MANGSAKITVSNGDWGVSLPSYVNGNFKFAWMMFASRTSTAQ
jgi:hypothetical protein